MDKVIGSWRCDGRAVTVACTLVSLGCSILLSPWASGSWMGEQIMSWSCYAYIWVWQEATPLGDAGVVAKMGPVGDSDFLGKKMPMGHAD